MKHLFILITLISCLTNIQAQEDIEGSQDYYLLPRMPEYGISKYEELVFDTQKFYHGKESSEIEGKKLIINYKYKGNKKTPPSELQIIRNYSNAIINAGGKILKKRTSQAYYNFINVDKKEIWIKIDIRNNGDWYSITIVEKEEMKQDINIDANLIKNQIDLNGKVAFYGIYFDIGESSIKEESIPTLIQIVKYLKNNPTINCWLVGHTDSDGSYQLNKKLSLERAQGVKKELEQKYNIEPTRLFAEGVWSLSPVSSNSTEEGKKSNRRVELVKKPF